MFKLWRVSVYQSESHTNPRWSTNVRTPNAAMAVICAMTHYSGTAHIGKIEVEQFDGYGKPSEEWCE